MTDTLVAIALIVAAVVIPVVTIWRAPDDIPCDRVRRTYKFPDLFPPDAPVRYDERMYRPTRKD